MTPIDGDEQDGQDESDYSIYTLILPVADEKLKQSAQLIMKLLVCLLMTTVSLSHHTLNKELQLMIYHSVRRTASRSCYLTADSHYISHELLVRPLPSGCRLTAIFDSCHSATVLDLTLCELSSMLYARTKLMFYSTPPTGPSKDPIFSPRLLKVFSEPVWVCFEEIQGDHDELVWSREKRVGRQ